MRNQPNLFFLLTVLLSLSLITACSRRDKTVNIDDDDPEMNAAIAKARETLPDFWMAFDRKDTNESTFALKVEISDKAGSEHFWLNNIEKENGKIFGTINNDPNIVRTVKLGERIEIPEADISDWLYERDGKMVGNFTLRVLFKKMPPAEVARYKRMLADP